MCVVFRFVLVACVVMVTLSEQRQRIVGGKFVRKSGSVDRDKDRGLLRCAMKCNVHEKCLGIVVLDNGSCRQRYGEQEIPGEKYRADKNLNYEVTAELAPGIVVMEETIVNLPQEEPFPEVLIVQAKAQTSMTEGPTTTIETPRTTTEEPTTTTEGLTTTTEGPTTTTEGPTTTTEGPTTTAEAPTTTTRGYVTGQDINIGGFDLKFAGEVDSVSFFVSVAQSKYQQAADVCSLGNMQLARIKTKAEADVLGAYMESFQRVAMLSYSFKANVGYWRYPDESLVEQTSITLGTPTYDVLLATDGREYKVLHIHSDLRFVCSSPIRGP